MGLITVVGLGPGGPDLVTAGTLRLLEEVRPAFLRTRRHPAAELLAEAESFDDVYESAATFEDVYAGIVGRLAAEAERHDRVLYAVPGSPAVAERTVELLVATEGLEVEVVPALSFCDLTWTVLGVDPVALGVTLVDGRRFETEAAGLSGPLLVSQCDQRHVLSDVKLAVDDGPSVTVLQRLGLPDQAVFEVAWAELDREVDPDHLTSLWIPRLQVPVAGAVAAFAEQARILRAECPWDREQTHASLRPYVVEEAREVVEAIEALGAAADDVTADAPDGAVAALESELGDLLFQVVIHATLGEERGWFDLGSVAQSIHDKLERRHPHVFGDAEASSPEDAIDLWRAAKRAEREGDTGR